MLQNYLKITFRNLLASRLFTFLNVTGLTGGMVTAVFILIWVQNELSFDSYHKNAKQIYRVITHLTVNKDETWHWSNSPLKLASEVGKLPEIEEVVRKKGSNNIPVRVGDRPLTGEDLVYVDPNWFKVFDYQFIEGSVGNFKSGTRNIALSESKARQLFGTTKVAGNIVHIDTLDYQVSGVFEDTPANSSFKEQIILPVSALLANPKIFENDNNWNNFNYETFVVLRPDANPKNIDQKITRIVSLASPDDNGKPSTNKVLELEHLKDLHFSNAGKGKDFGDKKTAYIFFGLALVILFVACINYVNLTTARANSRSKEVGVKKLLGAGQTHLFGQFMMESIATCSISFLLSIIMINILMPTFNNLTGQSFVFSVSNLTFWYVLIGTTVTAILLTGIYPSVLLSSFKPFNVLRGNGTSGLGKGSLRKGLVVVQFTVSIVFVISTLVVYLQMEYIRKKKLGFEKEHVFMFQIPWNLSPKVDPGVFKSMLSSNPSIESVTVASDNLVKIGSSSSGNFDWDGRVKDFNPTISQIETEANFASMFGLKIAQGRWFNDNSLADQDNVILNEAAVKKLNLGKSVVGKRFVYNGKEGVVIGVVRDFHFKSLREKIEPLAIFAKTDRSLAIYVKALPGKEAEVIESVGETWKKLIPARPWKYEFLDQTFDNLYKSEQRVVTLFNVFTVVALLISCLGLFGLATFTAERRFKEIGIRKTLGASVASIVSLLSADFIVLVLISMIVASPIGYYFMSKWLQGFEYKMDLSWWLFAAAGILSIVVALLTISFQSIKAALMNPVESLKAE